MVVESMGEYKYPDKGNMTRKEIDMTIGILIEASKGQFRALWSDFNESVNLMASGEVVINQCGLQQLPPFGRRVFRINH